MFLMQLFSVSPAPDAKRETNFFTVIYVFFCIEEISLQVTLYTAFRTDKEVFDIFINFLSLLIMSY